MAETLQIILQAIDKASAVFAKVGAASAAMGTSFNNLKGSTASVANSMNNALAPAVRASDVSAKSFNQSLGPLNNRMNDMKTVSAQAGTGMMQLGVAMVGVTAVALSAEKAYNQTVGAVINYNKSILDASRATRMGVEDLSRFVQVGDDMGVSMDSITRALQMATKNGFAPSIDAIADLADKSNAMSTSTERAAALAKMFGRNWAELDPILQLGGARIRELAAAQQDGLVVTEAEIAKSEELRLKIDVLSDSWTAYKNELGGKVIPVVIDYLDKATEQAEVSEDLRRAGELGIANYSEQSLALEQLARGERSRYEAIVAEIAAHDANNAATMRALGPVEALRVKNIELAEAIGGVGPAIEDLSTTQLYALAFEARLANNKELEAKYLREAAAIRDSDSALSEYITHQENMGGGSTGYLGEAPANISVGITRPSGEFTGGNTPNDNAWRAYWNMMAVEGAKAAGQAADIVSTLDAIRDKTVTVTILEDLQKDTRTYWEHGAASGADFTVPPGYPNDSYRMGVQSGEHVEVTPAGEKSPPGRNVTINVTSSPLDTQYMLKVIKASVGL